MLNKPWNFAVLTKIDADLIILLSFVNMNLISEMLMPQGY